MPHDEGDGIVTHDSEIWAFFIIRTLVSEVIDPSRVFLRDKKTYCGIIVDDNNRKPICRLYNFDSNCEGVGKNASIVILVDENSKGVRHSLTYLDELYPLAEELKKAALRHKEE